MPIDREKILKQLARVMNQAAESEETVARNRKTVAELDRDGQDWDLVQTREGMANLSPFYPAMTVFAGALLVALGGFWASYRQSNFNAEIKEKNEEIARLQRDPGITIQ